MRLKLLTVYTTIRERSIQTLRNSKSRLFRIAISSLNQDFVTPDIFLLVFHIFFAEDNVGRERAQFFLLSFFPLAKL